jgi:hypothetical protein
VAAYTRSLDFSGHGDSWQRGDVAAVAHWCVAVSKSLHTWTAALAHVAAPQPCRISSVTPPPPTPYSSPATYPPPASRDTFAARDVVEALAASPTYPSVTRLCGVGHSFGGAALLAAEVSRACAFDAVRRGRLPRWAASALFVWFPLAGP